MLKPFLFIVCILSAPLLTQARVITETSTQSSQGEGVGVTREEAVNKALVEALSKIEGVNINSVKSTSIFMDVSSIDGTTLVDAYTEDISKVTNGRVDSFEIDNVLQDPDGRYTANVTVYNTKISKRYQAPGLSPASRRSIIVLDSSSGHQDFNEILKHKFINKLVQSRKFNVLDREQGDLYSIEKAFIQSGNTMSDEIYKLGNQLGADYMFVYTAAEAEITSRVSNLTGREKLKAQLLIDYQVILFATGQVKYSNSLSVDTDIQDGSIKATHDALDRVVGRITNQVLEAIYPLRVADVVSDELVFSQELVAGDTYECFSEGDVIRDTYTKENTGRVESKTGTIEVVRTTNKLSYAKTTEGTVRKNEICRSLGNSAYLKGRDANYQLHKDGGVQLGF
jgi:hypothetical protein